MNKSGARITDSTWSGLYKIGGAAILIAIPIFLLDIVISLTVEGADIRPDTLTAIDLFILYQDNWLLGLRALGFINVITLTVSVPLFLALYAVHRQKYEAYATLAVVIWLVGTTIYISNNAAIPVFVLSRKYEAATTDAQRALLVAAGEAIIAKGVDFTPGSFIGFSFTEIAALAFSFVMLRSGIFSKVTAYSGILGFILLLIFTICLTFVPALFDVAMIIAMVGGLLGLAWYILVARRLLQLGRYR